MIERLSAFAVAGIGVAVFFALDLPLPWLLGPMIACLIAALLGVRMRGIAPVNASMRTILGVAVGAAFTPAVIVTLPGMWPTLILVPVMTLLIGLLGVPYYRRVWGYDQPTAYYAAMPGGLQDMLVFGEESGGNVRTLSLAHATRVLLVVVATPFILTIFWGADLSNPPGRPVEEIDPRDLAIILFCAGFGWWAAARVRLFGATILGPMIATAIAAMTGLLESRPPAEAIWAAQFFIGMTVGTKYSGVTLAEVRRDLTAAAGYCGILVVLTILFVEFVHLMGLASGLDALLAFAPGGQAELMVLALISGADLAFVAAHHILRMILVITCAPLAARWFRDR
jgi:membrane AbrB-like protein